ncbi:hypothetical protein HDV05_004324 [Chytridiales sp. JEL 0842]|nr:hypothetical protein HDV05_004324 [Chytridiales sp. JEL 0842]
MAPTGGEESYNPFAPPPSAPATTNSPGRRASGAQSNTSYDRRSSASQSMNASDRRRSSSSSSSNGSMDFESRQAQAIKSIVSKLNNRQGIAAIIEENEPVDQLQESKRDHHALQQRNGARSRRVSMISMTGEPGFNDIIHKVNDTYDIVKIVPATYSFLEELPTPPSDSLDDVKTSKYSLSGAGTSRENLNMENNLFRRLSRSLGLLSGGSKHDLKVAPLPTSMPDSNTTKESNTSRQSLAVSIPEETGEEEEPKSSLEEFNSSLPDFPINDPLQLSDEFMNKSARSLNKSARSLQSRNSWNDDLKEITTSQTLEPANRSQNDLPEIVFPSTYDPFAAPPSIHGSIYLEDNIPDSRQLSEVSLNDDANSIIEVTAQCGEPSRRPSTTPSITGMGGLDDRKTSVPQLFSSFSPRYSSANTSEPKPPPAKRMSLTADDARKIYTHRQQQSSRDRRASTGGDTHSIVLLSSTKPKSSSTFFIGGFQAVPSLPESTNSISIGSSIHQNPPVVTGMSIPSSPIMNGSRRASFHYTNNGINTTLMIPKTPSSKMIQEVTSRSTLDSNSEHGGEEKDSVSPVALSPLQQHQQLQQRRRSVSLGEAIPERETPSILTTGPSSHARRESSPLIAVSPTINTPPPPPDLPHPPKPPPPSDLRIVIYPEPTTPSEPAPSELLTSLESYNPFATAATTHRQNRLSVAASSRASSRKSSEDINAYATALKSGAPNLPRPSQVEMMMIPKSPVIGGETQAGRYLQALSALRNPSTVESMNGSQGSRGLKINSFLQTVKIAKDLKEVGEDASLAKDLDPATLQMVIGLKKWVRNKKKTKEKSATIKFIDDLQKRLEGELPRPIHFDILNDALSVMDKMVSSYQSQVGEKHSYTVGCVKHMEKLRLRVNERGLTLADQQNEEDETAAANAMVNHQHKNAAARKSHENVHKSRESLKRSHLGINHEY